jgi:hypothetical protein
VNGSAVLAAATPYPLETAARILLRSGVARESDILVGIAVGRPIMRGRVDSFAAAAEPPRAVAFARHRLRPG